MSDLGSVASAVERIVLDTNVLLSLWVFDDSRFLPIRAAIEKGRWVALTDAACLAEFERVLDYPAFKLDATRQRYILDDYAAIARPIPLSPCQSLPRCSDRDDQKFLELACNGAARFVVTADKALLKLARHKTFREKLEIRIVGPQQFLENSVNLVP